MRTLYRCEIKSKCTSFKEKQQHGYGGSLLTVGRSARSFHSLSIRKFVASLLLSGEYLSLICRLSGVVSCQGRADNTATRQQAIRYKMESYGPESEIL